MRLEFMNGTEVLHQIGEDRIERYDRSGRKLIAEDYFMNEPASVRLVIIADSWLLERWEDEVVKVNDALWFKWPVRVWDIDYVSGGEVQTMAGLLQATESSHKPLERRMEVVVYDYSALLSELDIKIRFYYPWDAGYGTNWDHFIINYQLPGEGENEPPEDDGTRGDNPVWFPYLHSIETADRQVSSVLQALTQIWAECYAAEWELQFNHAYEMEGSDGTEVNNYIVNLAGETSFYRQFVLGLVVAAHNSFAGQSGMANWQFWANHGFISAAQRMEIYEEYGMLPSAECDGYFVMRAGYTYSGTGGPLNPSGWQGGEMGEGNGPFQYQEWWRIFRVQDGVCVQDLGQRHRSGQGLKLGNLVGGVNLNASGLLEIGADSFYRCTANEYYTIPEAYAIDILGYFYSLTYFVYFTGIMQGPGGYIGNRIFRMKSGPGEPGQAPWLEQTGREWFKTMLFIGDLSCFADETGILQIVPRSPLGDILLPLDWLVDIRQKLLVYRPWDQSKLSELINDAAEIRYLIEYYGGTRVLTHELDLEFVQRGWSAAPGLRQRFVLEGQIGPSVEFSQPREYMIVEITETSEKRVKIRAVSC